MIRNSCWKFILLSAAALSVMSCAGYGDSVPVEDGYGTLALGSVAVSSGEAVTRAVSTDDFILRVWDIRNALVGEWVFSERPSDLRLKVGDYRLEVCSPQLADADWESPWYVGGNSFTIERDVRTEVGVVCRLGNIKVTVSYSEGLQEFIADDAEVTVTIGGGSLVFGRYESKAGYFRAADGGADMAVSLTATIEGVRDTYTSVISGVRPGEWEKVRFAYEESDGARTFTIYVGEFVVGQITPGSDWGVIN